MMASKLNLTLSATVVLSLVYLLLHLSIMPPQHHWNSTPLSNNTVQLSKILGIGNLTQVNFSSKSEANHKNVKSQSFPEFMKSFPWDDFEKAYKNQTGYKADVYSTLLMKNLIPFIKKAPPLPLNESCKPAAELKVLSSPTFTCIPRDKDKPRRVGMLFNFGFEVDMLEINLHELDDVVDKFFLIESVVTHNALIPKKPLIWESLKHEDRFKKFAHKVVHFIVDDADVAQVWRSKDMWIREWVQILSRWTKFLQWNNETEFFRDDDLIGIADIDEVALRDAVFTLKTCNTSSPTFPNVDIGSWFPWSNIYSAFKKSDWPVPNHPYTLGDPTFWTLGNARKFYYEKSKVPDRMRGKSGTYLLGGIHLSKYPYLPYLMIKNLASSESSLWSILAVLEAAKIYNQGGSPKEARAAFGRKGVKDAEMSADRITWRRIPWFLECNRDRFPSWWEEKVDLRLVE